MADPEKAAPSEVMLKAVSIYREGIHNNSLKTDAQADTGINALHELLKIGGEEGVVVQRYISTRLDYKDPEQVGKVDPLNRRLIARMDRVAHKAGLGERTATDEDIAQLEGDIAVVRLLKLYELPKMPAFLRSLPSEAAKKLAEEVDPTPPSSGQGLGAAVRGLFGRGDRAGQSHVYRAITGPSEQPLSPAVARPLHTVPVSPIARRVEEALASAEARSEARAFLGHLDQEASLAPISADFDNFERILRQNGITEEEINSKNNRELVALLRQKVAPQPEPARPIQTVLPAYPLPKISTSVRSSEVVREPNLEEAGKVELTAEDERRLADLHTALDNLEAVRGEVQRAGSQAAPASGPAPAEQHPVPAFLQALRDEPEPTPAPAPDEPEDPLVEATSFNSLLTVGAERLKKRGRFTAELSLDETNEMLTAVLGELFRKLKDTTGDNLAVKNMGVGFWRKSGIGGARVDANITARKFGFPMNINVQTELSNQLDREGNPTGRILGDEPKVNPEQLRGRDVKGTIEKYIGGENINGSVRIGLNDLMRERGAMVEGLKLEFTPNLKLRVNVEGSPV